MFCVQEWLCWVGCNWVSASVCCLWQGGQCQSPAEIRVSWVIMFGPRQSWVFGLSPSQVGVVTSSAGDICELLDRGRTRPDDNKSENKIHCQPIFSSFPTLEVVGWVKTIIYFDNSRTSLPWYLIISSLWRVQVVRIGGGGINPIEPCPTNCSHGPWSQLHSQTFPCIKQTRPILHFDWHPELLEYELLEPELVCMSLTRWETF